ncbi:hypothetical protein [Bradyrhizobium sp. Tv2a-2]|nr:hypothetical protein [Bradyrhizobium sp. Tv2a-2]
MMRYLGANKSDYPRPWDHKVFNLILRTEISGDEVSVKKVREKF